MIKDAREDHWTEKVFRRAWLILLNTAAGAVMAIVATVIVCANDPAEIVSVFVLCVYTGGVLGLVCSLVVTPLIHRRRLLYAIPIVHVLTGVVCLTVSTIMRGLSSTVYEPGLWIGALTCGANILGAVVASICLPTIHHLYHWGRHCLSCGYDITGNDTVRCPECGSAVVKTKATLPVSAQPG